MKQISSTMTQRGQVTLPAEVRRLLGVKPRDKVTFTIDGGEVRLEAPPFSLESAFGSVQPSTRPEDLDGITRAAKDAKAEQTARELYKT